MGIGTTPLSVNRWMRESAKQYPIQLQKGRSDQGQEVLYTNDGGEEAIGAIFVLHDKTNNYTILICKGPYRRVSEDSLSAIYNFDDVAIDISMNLIWRGYL